MNASTKMKIVYIVLTVLMVTFFVRDWYVYLVGCGVVEQCLQDSSHYQNYAKFAVTLIVTIVTFSIGKNQLSPQDRKFLQAGFVMALCADFCLKILHNVSALFKHSSDYTLLGICFFMVVQALFIYRHSRTSDEDFHFPWILFVPFGVMFVSNAALIFTLGNSVNAEPLTSNPALVPIIATYGTFLICSLIVACKAPKVGYFSMRNATLIKRGMILFFCCDACVGISLATGPDYSVQEHVATIANNFVWYFYTPALILLARSGFNSANLENS